MREEGGPGRARGRSKVLIPVPGGRGYFHLGEDELDEPVKQCGLVLDVAIDGHRDNP